MNHKNADDAKKSTKTKKRDSEYTRGLLIDAVASILSVEGYDGLNLSKVAFQAGVDKKMIYHHFSSFNGLLKAYIRSRDFWTPAFGKLDFDNNSCKEEIMEMISGIMTDQFKYFFSHPEMQKFILWQVSKPDTLLRKVIEERESIHKKLVLLAEPDFSGSGISVRSVLAILLGGIYYMVWHAGTNKSALYGIDITKQSDREQFLSTIDKIISIIWQAAETSST